jgi:hypothetical protein
VDGRSLCDVQGLEEPGRSAVTATFLVPAPTHSLLNHPQREHLSVLLSQMEDALDRLRVVSQPRTGVERCLTVVDDDLPVRLRNGIEPIVTRLRECAEHLTGYGPVAPGLDAALDPALRELHDGWAAIKRLLADR